MGVKVRMKVGDAALKALQEKLEAIDTKASRKGMRSGINQVTKEVLGEAKVNVPERSGRLKKTLGRKVKSYRQSKIIAGIVGPRKGMLVTIDGVRVDPAKYAHLVEYGRGPVEAGTKKNRRTGNQDDTGRRILSSQNTAVSPQQPDVFGPEVGPVEPHPFLRPAYDAVRPRVNATLAKHLNQAIADLVNKTRSRRTR